MAKAITRAEKAKAETAAKMRLPLASKSNMGVFLSGVGCAAGNQATRLEEAGTIAVAMATAERATAKAAAKKRSKFRVILYSFLKFRLVCGTIPLDTRYIAIAVPVL